MIGRSRIRDDSSVLPRAAIIAILAVSVAPLLSVILSIQPAHMLSTFIDACGEPRTLASILFTLKQSAASSILALAFGLPGAWLYARHSFVGRTALMTLSAVPFCVPPVLVILAFVLYFGNAGIINRAMEAISGSRPGGTSFLYSFSGIVLIHAFYNFPVVIQIVGGTWARLPPSREDAARVLGARGFRAFLTGTLPSLGPAIGQATSLVFLFCFFSFSVVLVFGGLGGSTLEVEVYRRARLEADSAGAAAIAIIQTSIALISVGAFGLFERKTTEGARFTGSRSETRRPRGITRFFLILYGVFVVVFFLGPLLALFMQSFILTSGWDRIGRVGARNYERLLFGSDPVLVRALWHTLVTAIPASLIATMAGIVLAYGRLGSERESRSRFLPGIVQRKKIAHTIALDLAGSLPLAVSGVVTALGWMLIFPDGGFGPIILAQATVAFPFVYRGISGAFASLERGPRLAARSLGASPIQAFITVDLPAAAPSLAASAAFAFSIAAGDVNAPLILGTGDFQSLPLLLFRLVGTYRFPEACAVGVVLAVLTASVFLLKERTGDAS